MNEEIRETINARNIEFVDLMYTDILGAWHHVTVPTSYFGDKLCASGVGVDGSSVTGFRKVKSGDMVLIPDTSSSFLHPFTDRPTLCVLGDLVDVDAREGFSRDCRYVARKAERHLARTLENKSSLWLPELEFYLFDSLKVDNRTGHAGYEILTCESGAAGYQPREPEHGEHRRGYHAASPEDRFEDIRAEMCAMLQAVGIPVKYHHHEVGPAGQLEIELNFMPLLRAADSVALAKWVIRNLAAQNALVAVFMPKPMYAEAGSGLHYHQYLVDGKGSAFYDGEGDALLSGTGRGYVAGLLKHGRALSAFANPSTNSYKRLVPGFEAPVHLAYSIGNRTAAIRIPGYAQSADNLRVEYRPPDATSNSHLVISAMLMAGLDGIRRGLDPGKPLSRDLFHMDEAELAAIPALPADLGEALDALEEDHEFLLEGGVFTQDLLDAWIDLKREEMREMAERPHPWEYELYMNL
jgi:glutamine synthetase